MENGCLLGSPLTHPSHPPRGARGTQELCHSTWPFKRHVTPSLPPSGFAWQRAAQGCGEASAVARREGIRGGLFLSGPKRRPASPLSHDRLFTNPTRTPPPAPTPCLPFKACPESLK